MLFRDAFFTVKKSTKASWCTHSGCAKRLFALVKVNALVPHEFIGGKKALLFDFT